MQPPALERPIYFSGLDGLRLFGALAVVIHHIELIKGDTFGTQLWRTAFFQGLGPLSVTFFFTLSGFLITYFLFKEKNKSGSINLNSFFIRRSVRLVPVYYLIILLSFIILPHVSIFKQPIFSERIFNNFIFKFSFFIVLLPQIPYILFPNAPIPYAVQSWAIGVENIFYLLWPWLIKSKLKFITVFAITLIIFTGIPSILIIYFKLNQVVIDKNSAFLVLRFFDTMRFSCMAIGGLFGWILFLNLDKYNNFFKRRTFQLILFTVIGILLAKGVQLKLLSHEMYSILFSFLIINFALVPKSTLNKFFSILIFDYLGKCSYGIYMYHMIAIQIAFIALNNIRHTKNLDLLGNAILYCVTFGITIATAMVSFRYIEKPFSNSIISLSNKK